jgi:hypothetical protein
MFNATFFFPQLCSSPFVLKNVLNGLTMWAIVDLMFKGITNETFISNGATFVDLILFCSLPYDFRYPYYVEQKFHL